jgi:hypothetical protein
MPEIDDSDRPDLTDLSDDDIRSIKDVETRDALYRVTARIKDSLLYLEKIVTDLYEAVTALE